MIKTKNYVKVDATITKVDYHLIPPDQSVEYYIEFSYDYNNENYVSRSKILFTFNKKVGKKIKIYINPNNPSEVRNDYINNTTILMIIIPLLVFPVSVYGYRIKRNK